MKEKRGGKSFRGRMFDGLKQKAEKGREKERKKKKRGKFEIEKLLKKG